MNSTKTNKKKREEKINGDLQRGRRLLGEEGHQRQVETFKDGGNGVENGVRRKWDSWGRRRSVCKETKSSIYRTEVSGFGRFGNGSHPMSAGRTQVGRL